MRAIAREIGGFGSIWRERNAGEMLLPERLNTGSLAGGADGFDFGGKRGKASIALGRDGLYRRGGHFSQGERRFALGGNLLAQFGHDFEQDIANELFQLSAG